MCDDLTLPGAPGYNPIEPASRTYLCVDPGLKHVGVVLVTIERSADRQLKARVRMTSVGDLSGSVNPAKDKAKDFFSEIGWSVANFDGKIDAVIIEYQPPLNTARNPALVRWNSWVEAYAVAFFHATFPLIPVNYVHSNSVKRAFNIRAKDHHVNKRLAVMTANEYLEERVMTDHEADCVLMGLFSFLQACPASP